MMATEQLTPAVAGPLDQPVVQPAPERDDFYYDDASEPDEPQCERCHGDRMDPWCDYLMPCPLCQGEQRP